MLSAAASCFRASAAEASAVVKCPNMDISTAITKYSYNQLISTVSLQVKLPKVTLKGREFRI